MLDKLLEVGSAFDWISPIAGLLGDVVSGPSHTFLIPYDGCPLSGREIQILLKRKGVRTWGVMITGGTLMVSVRLSQARWAQHLLEQAGVPMENPIRPKDGGRTVGIKRSTGRRPTRQRKGAATLVDSVQEVLNTRLF